MNLLSRSVSRRYLAGISAFLVLVSACLSLQSAQLTKPSANDRHVALAVTTLLKHEHLLRDPADVRHPSNTTISERCMKTFLQSLDPMKMYFYQSDTTALRPTRTSLPIAPSRATSVSPTRSSTRSWPASTSA